MLSSLFLFGSSLVKNKTVSVLLSTLLIINLARVQMWKVNNTFFFINMLVFLFIIAFAQKIKNEKVNAGISITSILIWSIIIDVICYFMFPKFVMGQTIFQYVWQGILYNYKYVFVNAAIYGVVKVIEHYKGVYSQKQVVTEWYG